MEITAGTPEWDDVEDRDLWRQFLATQTGRRLIARAVHDCPALLAGGGVNEILIRSGEVRGFSLLTQSFLTLATGEIPVPAQEGTSAYPPLDDDSKWTDGQKVNS